MESKNRKLLVLYDEEPHGSSLSSPTFITYPIPEPHAPGAAISAASSPPRHLNPPLDSSLTLTFTVLLAALFFLAFFSVFVRRFSDHGNDSSLRHSRRRRRRRGPDSSRPSDELGSRKGTESSAVRSLPVVAYCAGATYQIDCAICLAEFEEGEAVKLIPGCRHVFHSECIDTWLLYHVTCPVCRGTQLFASSESLLMSRSTVQRGDTCMDPRVVTTSGLRRTRSCSSGREQEVLIHRTSSY